MDEPMEVNREDLLRRIEMAKFGISPKGIIEQSKCVVLTGGHFFTFNDEVFCRSPSGLPNGFNAAIPADPLLQILWKLKEERIQLKLSDSLLWLYAKKKKISIKVENEIHLPIDKIEIPPEWVPLHKDFCTGIDLIKECVGTDQTQVPFPFIHITPDYLEATDDAQVGKFRVRTPIKQNVLVRGSSIKNIVPLGVTQFCETDAWLHFKNEEGMIFACRKHLYDFPQEVSKVFEVEGQQAILPKGLESLVENAEVFSSENAKDKNLLSIDLSEQEMRVRAEGELGCYRERKTVQYSGPPLKFIITPKILAEVAKKKNECQITNDVLIIKEGRFSFCACLGREVEPNHNGVNHE
jgi:hypothetical protein